MPFKITEINVSQESVQKRKRQRKDFAFIHFLMEITRNHNPILVAVMPQQILTEQVGVVIKILESEGLKCHLLHPFQERELRPRKMRFPSSQSSRLTILRFLIFVKTKYYCCKHHLWTKHENTGMGPLIWNPWSHIFLNPESSWVSEEQFRCTYHISHNILCGMGQHFLIKHINISAVKPGNVHIMCNKYGSYIDSFMALCRSGFASRMNSENSQCSEFSVLFGV